MSPPDRLVFEYDDDMPHSMAMPSSVIWWRHVSDKWHKCKLPQIAKATKTLSTWAGRKSDEGEPGSSHRWIVREVQRPEGERGEKVGPFVSDLPRGEIELAQGHVGKLQEGPKVEIAPRLGGLDNHPRSHGWHRGKVFVHRDVAGDDRSAEAEKGGDTRLVRGEYAPHIITLSVHISRETVKLSARNEGARVSGEFDRALPAALSGSFDEAACGNPSYRSMELLHAGYFRSKTPEITQPVPSPPMTSASFRFSDFRYKR